MTDESLNKQEEDSISKARVMEKFHIQSTEMLVWTLLYSLLGVTIYVAISGVTMPYIIVDMFTFGLAPALAIIALAGAIRGPLAGFLTGYLGTLLSGILYYGVVVTMTLPSAAFGILGFIVGLATYDLANGRSLIKLSILSAIGFIFTVLLLVVIGLVVEEYATLVAMGFVLLPELTLGLPSVLLLTPVLGRLWHAFMLRFKPEVIVKN
jgi:energy-coupling factor transport system substrate-specific component